MAEAADVDYVDGADARGLADAGDVELEGVGVAEDGQLGREGEEGLVLVFLVLEIDGVLFQLGA